MKAWPLLLIAGYFLLKPKTTKSVVPPITPTVKTPAQKSSNNLVSRSVDELVARGVLDPKYKTLVNQGLVNPASILNMVQKHSNVAGLF